MFGRNPFHLKSEKILERLKEFEQFCLGNKHLSPEKFMHINKELSLNAVLYIGRHTYKSGKSGKHLIWTDLTDRVHDLGPIDHIDIMHELPGFHKGRTLAISAGDIKETDMINVQGSRKQMTRVMLADGSEGIGPDFKTALRNAALRKSLQSNFKKARGLSFWDRSGGNA